MSKKYTDEELERMINSNDWRDRLEVAKQGYELVRLINDPFPYVRAEVAKQGYGLDILIQGYGLDILINDPDCRVRKMVQDYHKE